MIPRHLKDQILKYSKEYPILALVGPRQSGKTTLIKALFPSYKYISLENIDYKEQALTDPRGFLDNYGPYLILDEVQRVPDLFSYLQEIVDNNQDPAQYILTGSSQFLLVEKITQSLAGRIVTFKLYPLSYLELNRFSKDKDYKSIFQKEHLGRQRITKKDFYQLIIDGLYPRIYDKKIDSHKWQENYLLTYVERDVRSLLNVKNIRTFESFLKICASLSGQLINYSNISNALGISIPTVKQWISILETSGIIFILQPYFSNFSKRIVKTPKLYFVDTGILCHLLSIRNIDHLISHPLIGSIFETFIVGECFKRFYNLGEVPPLYFWRDRLGNEIDLLITDRNELFPVEIKLSQTYTKSFKSSVEKWLNLPGNNMQKGLVIYTGKEAVNLKSNIPVIPWDLL